MALPRVIRYSIDGFVVSESGTLVLLIAPPRLTSGTTQIMLSQNETCRIDQGQRTECQPRSAHAISILAATVQLIYHSLISKPGMKGPLLLS